MSPAKRSALLVGAGAVGLVYGRHLARAGLDVSFLVKPKHAAEAHAGYTLYPLHRPERGAPARFTGFGVLTDVADLASRRFDEIWICVSSTALRGASIGELISRVGDATLVMLQPGLEDRAFLIERGARDERLVSGLIAFLSYQTPLPGETRATPGVAYWFPPLFPSAFGGGAEGLAAGVAARLASGGCPARAEPDLGNRSALMTALFMPAIAALEVEGWSLEGLRRSEGVELASRAGREAAAAALGGAVPRLARWLAGPAGLRFALQLAPHLVPLPLESYLRYHFTKVGDQTLAQLETYVRVARERRLPCQALEDVLGALAAARAAPLEG